MSPLFYPDLLFYQSTFEKEETFTQSFCTSRGLRAFHRIIVYPTLKRDFRSQAIDTYRIQLRLPSLPLVIPSLIFTTTDPPACLIYQIQRRPITATFSTVFPLADVGKITEIKHASIVGNRRIASLVLIGQLSFGFGLLPSQFVVADSQGPCRDVYACRPAYQEGG